MLQQSIAILSTTGEPRYVFRLTSEVDHRAEAWHIPCMGFHDSGYATLRRTRMILSPDSDSTCSVIIAEADVLEALDAIPCESLPSILHRIP
jgi:hypothetical protein